MLGNARSSTTRRLRWCALTGLVAAAACSTVPGHNYPPFTDHDVTFAYAVPASGQLPLPTTSTTLQVHSLRAEPPPTREWYDANGQRWFGYAPGTRVLVRTRYRIYADADGSLRLPGQVFVGGELQPAPTTVGAPR